MFHLLSGFSKEFGSILIFFLLEKKVISDTEMNTRVIVCMTDLLKRPNVRSLLSEVHE